MANIAMRVHAVVVGRERTGILFFFINPVRTVRRQRFQQYSHSVKG